MKKAKLLSGIIALSLLAGCGSNPPAADTSSSESTSVESTVSAEENSSVDTEQSASVEEEVTPTEEDNGATSVSSEEDNDDTSAADDEYADAVLKDLSADYFTFGVGINGSTLENQTLNIPEYMELAKGAHAIWLGKRRHHKWITG